MFKWQIFDIEQIKPKVIKYQVHMTEFECGCINKAQIPNEVLTSNFCKYLIALIAYLTAVLKGFAGSSGILCHIFKFTNQSWFYSKVAWSSPSGNTRQMLWKKRSLN